MEKINILITEDEPIIAADLSDRLEQAGYNVLACLSSGEETLEFLEKEIPDLLLMDVRLEGELDGIETVERIRKKHKLPLIYLTSNTDPLTFARAKATKPHAFIGKPFRGRDLQHSIELALHNFAAESKPATVQPDKEDNSYVLSDRIFIKEKNRLIRLLFTDIQWIQADGYYCKIHTSKKSYLMTMTLKKLTEANVLPDWLVRVHRSYLVNTRHIESMSDIFLRIGSNKIPLGNSYRDNLKRHLRIV